MAFSYNSRIREAQVINAGQVFVEGIGFLGVTGECEIPAIEFETYEQNGGFYKSNLNTGILKPLTLKVKFTEYNKVLMESMSNQFDEESRFYIKWNVSSPKGHFSHTATFRGNITKNTYPKIKFGEAVEVEMELQAYFMKVESEGVQDLLVDTRSLTCMIGDKDIWQEIRSNVM